MARATASRGSSSSTKRSPCGVVQRRALPAHRLRDEEAVASGDADDRRGMELDELEVGQLGARGAGQQQAGSVRARRVGRARPQRGRPARGQDDGARLQHPPVVAGDGPDAAVARPRAGRAPGDPRARRSAGSSTTSAESWRRMRRPVALPPACATRRIPWPPSSPSASRPWRSASKRTPSASRSANRAGASSHSTRAADCAHEPAAGGDRVAQVQLGRVVVGERGGEPALRPVGRGLGERPGGDQRDARALARGDERA